MKERIRKVMLVLCAMVMLCAAAAGLAEETAKAPAGEAQGPRIHFSSSLSWQ